MNASAFKADMTFEQALDALRNSTKPPLKIIVLWRQLEPAGIDPYTPIKTDAIYGEHSRTINGLSIKNTLNILLASVSAGPSKLVWSARDGTIVIGLKKSNGNKKTCLYNVADLTSAPSNAAANPYGYNGFNQSQNPGLNNSASAAGGNRLQQSAYGGASNSFYSPITSISSGTSLGTGAGFGGMGGMGYGGMGFGGGFGQMGFGGMGLNSTVDTPLQQQIRQQQLKTLLQSSIAPGSWQ